MNNCLKQVRSVGQKEMNITLKAMTATSYVCEAQKKLKRGRISKLQNDYGTAMMESHIPTECFFLLRDRAKIERCQKLSVRTPMPV